MVKPPIFSLFAAAMTPPTSGRVLDVTGLSKSFVLVALLLAPASNELEYDESLLELVLKVLVLALPVLPPLELVFVTPPVFVLAFSFELKSLNLSSIEFCLLSTNFDLWFGILFCEVGCGVEDWGILCCCCLSGVADWLRGTKPRPLGVGIPDAAGDEAL